jgi:predicted flap endonuclease-1-like 5' DNA nuclease
MSRTSPGGPTGMTDDDLPSIGGPATRALADAGITRLSQVAEHTEAELAALHGVGPQAIRVLRVTLAERGRSFSR